MLEKIIRNSARCETCGDEIECTQAHKMQGCSCGRLYVDGYLTWLRRVYDGPWTETSIVERDGKRIYIRTGEPADE